MHAQLVCIAVIASCVSGFISETRWNVPCFFEFSQICLIFFSKVCFRVVVLDASHLLEHLPCA